MDLIVSVPDFTYLLYKEAMVCSFTEKYNSKFMIEPQC